MDKVARLPAERRRELFSETAASMGMLAGLIEKDFWVCWILKRLFSIPAFKSHLLFKGGTTLSKIFGVIRRFSEDIDLAVDWEMLGFVDEKSPLADLSTTKRNALLDEMLEACRGYICTDFLETLRERVAEELPNFDSWQLVTDQMTTMTGTSSISCIPPQRRKWNTFRRRSGSSSVPTRSSFPMTVIP